MDKRIQDVIKFVRDEKNRTTVIAAGAGVAAAIVAGIMVTAKRGKKRK